MNTVSPLLSPSNTSPPTGGFAFKKMENKHVLVEQDENTTNPTSTTTTTRGMDLAELLVCRAAPLNERELWAVCRQAANGIASQIESMKEFIPHEADVFIVSPKSMYFSSSGDVTLKIIQSNDDLEQYFAPELDAETENTPAAETMYTKCCQPASLVFSLAATLFMAADYNLLDEEEPAITEEMELLLSSMTDEDVADRATLSETAELAADGLMVCEDNEDPELSRHIVANMFDAADSIRVSKTIKSTPRNGSRTTTTTSSSTHAVEGGRTLQAELLQQLSSGVPLKKVPEETLRRPAEVVFTTRDILLQGIRSPTPLAAVTARKLKPLAHAHIARIAPPPTYVTPRDALLQDIAKAKRNLKKKKGGSSSSPSKPIVNINNLSSTLKKINPQLRTPTTKSPNGNKKILLTPTIDIMADWDPNKQVQLGFATESAKTEFKKQQHKSTSQLQSQSQSQSQSQQRSNNTHAHTHVGVEPTRRRLVSLSVLPELDLIAQSSSRRASEMVVSPPPTTMVFNNDDGSQNISTADKWKRKRSSLRLSKRRSSSSSSTTSTSTTTDVPPPSPPRTIDIEDWGHIRASLVKAKLENLGDEQPELHAAIVSNRSCGMCHVRFGIFKTIRHCVICKLGVCGTCAPHFEWPAHLQKQLDAMRSPKARTTSICNDCKLCLGGRSPTRPLKQITSPIVV